MSSGLLNGKRITLALTGGIALYKICDVVRGLRRLGADVKVAMTEHAAEFVTPLTFEALSGHPVALTEWQPTPDGTMPHIDLTRGADLLLVAPATANILAKAARGIADDLVSTLIAARRCPIVFVPAMNVNMWRNAPNRRNVEILREAGARFIGPVAGAQACGDEGEGRMTEPADILDRLEGIFAEPVLAGRRVLVTAGPTFEALDAVRGITNRSSGRQGWDLARAARDAGAEVTLVAGPTALRTPEGVRRIDVVSALEMHATVLGELERSSSEGHPYDLFFGVAAVADWRPADHFAGKWKKGASPEDPYRNVRWVQNPDILADVARSPFAPQAVVGFAAECESLEAYAHEKLERKGARLIIANDVREAAGSAENRILIVSKDATQAFGPAPKRVVAEAVVKAAAAVLG